METRANILQQFASRMEVHVPHDVIQLLATQLDGDARRLAGALNQLEATSRAYGREIDIRLAERTVREGLSVRQVESLASAGGTTPKTRRRAPAKSPEVRDLEARLREALGTKVSVEPGRKPGTGRIVIQFFNQDDLDRILERLE